MIITLHSDGTTRSRTAKPQAAAAQLDLFEFSENTADLHLQLRLLLTEVFMHPEPARRLIQVTAVVPKAHLPAWHCVTHTLLARRLSLSDAGSPCPQASTLAAGLTAQWEQPSFKGRWQRLIGPMDARQCRRLLARARRQLQLHAVH